jgi:hypothetical protein
MPVPMVLNQPFTMPLPAGTKPDRSGVGSQQGGAVSVRTSGPRQLLELGYLRAPRVKHSGVADRTTARTATHARREVEP